MGQKICGSTKPKLEKQKSYWPWHGFGFFCPPPLMSIPHFVQIWLMGTKCSAEMWFVESNSEYFVPLTSGGHLGFWDKWKILAQACFKGQVVFPCQILSSSDEREPNAEPKCYLWGQIWSILDFWPLAAILNIAINEKYLLRLVFMFN